MKTKITQGNRKIKAKVSLATAETQLHRTCDQMNLIYSKIQHIHLRQQRVKHKSLSTQSHNLALQLTVFKNMYSAYYQYAAVQAEQLKKLYLYEDHSQQQD